MTLTYVVLRLLNKIIVSLIYLGCIYMIMVLYPPFCFESGSSATQLMFSYRSMEHELLDELNMPSRP